MAAQSEMRMSSASEFMLPILEDVINDLQIQIQKGEALITNRPITKSEYKHWEGSTCRILEKSVLFDPTLVDRFLGCGAYGSFQKKSNEAFWENHRAMSIYDKVRIVDYHLNTLKKIKNRPDLMLDS